METDDATGPPYPAPPAVMWRACPIATTLRSLGRKWTLTVLRDIAFYPKASFAQIRKGNPGLTARTLSIRLNELAKEGLVEKVVPDDAPRHPYYQLTADGLEIWPILAALMQYGMRNHAATVFGDGRPRSLTEVYPADAGLMLGSLTEYARTVPPGSSSSYIEPALPRLPPAAPVAAEEPSTSRWASAGRSRGRGRT